MTVLATLVGTVLQFEPTPDPGGLDVSVTLGGTGAGAFLTTLFVGAIMVALAPEYTERMMEDFREDVIGSFAYGIAALLMIALVAVLLVISIVGFLFVIPFLVIAYTVWAIGATVAFLAIADRLVSREDGWLKPLVVTAVINGGLTLTGVGGLVAICVGAAGFGAVLQDWQA